MKTNVRWGALTPALFTVIFTTVPLLLQPIGGGGE